MVRMYEMVRPSPSAVKKRVTLNIKAQIVLK